jgi:hypothetical protein
VLKTGSMRKTAGTITLAAVSCVLLSYPLLSCPAVLAQGEPSLIESALEGKLEGESARPSSSPESKAAKSSNQALLREPIKNAAPGSRLAPSTRNPGSKQKSASKQISLPKQHAGSIQPSGAKQTPDKKLLPTCPVMPAGTLQGPDGKPVVKLVKPAVKSEASPQPKDASENIPEPNGSIEQPIHSAIPYHQPRVPVFEIDYGKEKTDKTFAIDPTYRGKPALPSVPTVTFGKPSWAIPGKKQIAVGAPAAPLAPATMPPAAVGQVNPAAINPAAANPIAAPPAGNPAVSNPAAPSTISGQPGTALKGQQPQQPELYELNVRILTDEKFSKKDTLWAYPFPPKLPKQVLTMPLPESEKELKSRLLATGYTARPDLTRPYPPGGWRWIKALQSAMKKANTGYAHTMITMYPWVNKMFPYVLSECREMNLVEEKRSMRYERLSKDYEKTHIDIEAQATSGGLLPLEIKVNPRGIAQARLPAGNWWITCTRAYPGLKFYWMVPVSCAVEEKVINVQLNEANALLVAGGW